MGAAETRCVTGGPNAHNHLHVGMVGLHGEKMSKSKGNLVFASTLRQKVVAPAWPCSPTTTAPPGPGPTPSCLRQRPGQNAGGPLLPLVRDPTPPLSWPLCAHTWPTTSIPPPPWPPSTPGPTPRLRRVVPTPVPPAGAA